MLDMQRIIYTAAEHRKIINNKIVELEEECKAEYPDFSADCKFYGENKESSHFKILIDSSFNLVLLFAMHCQLT